MTDIGKEYGAALLMLGAENNKEKESARDLDTVKALFCENEEYRMLLSSPALPLKERLSLIESSFGDVVCEHVLSFVQLMCEKGRMEAFDSAYEEYKALLDASMRASKARITSAVELSDDEKERLLAKLSKAYQKNVTAEYFVDGSLIGGVIVELDGTVIDGSIRQRLSDVKDVINK